MIQRGYRRAKLEGLAARLYLIADELTGMSTLKELEELHYISRDIRIQLNKIQSLVRDQ